MGKENGRKGGGKGTKRIKESNKRGKDEENLVFHLTAVCGSYYECWEYYTEL
jgi:hypothetical protein